MSFNFIFGLGIENCFQIWQYLFCIFVKITIYVSTAPVWYCFEQISFFSTIFNLEKKINNFSSSKFLAQLSKLTSSGTQELYEKQQISPKENDFSKVFGPRVPMFWLLGNISSTVVKTVSRYEQESWTVARYEQVFSTVARTAFYVNRRTFWRRTNSSKKTQRLIFLRFWASNFRSLVKTLSTLVKTAFYVSRGTLGVKKFSESFELGFSFFGPTSENVLTFGDLFSELL